LCSCDENFCNTFLFLKSAPIHAGEDIATLNPHRASTSIDGPKSSRQVLDKGSRLVGSVDGTGEHRVFERVDGPPGEFATFDHTSMGN
jgi:hypothetical protein